MNKKLRTALIIAVLVLALILGGMVFGILWYRNNHIFVEGEAYPKTAEYLNLRDTGISVSHYEAVREALPDCEIEWDIPFQGKYYPNDTKALAISAIAQEELPLLAYLTQLEVIDANSCQNFDHIAMLMQAYPHVRVLYHVTVDGQTLDQDTTEVALAHLSDAEVEQLAHLSQLTAVHAEGCTDYAQLLRLQESQPQCAVTYTVSIAGEEYPQDTGRLDFEGNVNITELSTALEYLPKVKSVTIAEPTVSAQELVQLQQKYAGIHITWYKTVGDVVYYNQDQEIDMSAMDFETLEEVEAFMAYFPNAEKAYLGKTSLDNEAVAQFREEKRDSYKVVWQVKVCGAMVRTDITYFMPVKYNMKVRNDQLGNLVYCEDLLCVDLGHKIVTDLSWLSGMPHLKYLIVAHNTLRDLGPIGQLKELVYLEVWDTWATDYTALYGCTALEDLNVSDAYLNIDLKQFGEMPWLKNLWLNQNGATKEERDYLMEHLPDTHINFEGYSPTAGGWRELKNYYDMRDLLEMPYNPW